MTDQERDELLLTIAATQREHGEKLDSILTIAQGQRRPALRPMNGWPCWNPGLQTWSARPSDCTATR